MADQHAVLRLNGQEWVACGKGWSQIHLYKDTADGTHRIVGWTVSDYDVIVNANITSKVYYVNCHFLNELSCLIIVEWSQNI